MPQHGAYKLKKCTTSEQDKMFKTANPRKASSDQVDFYDYGQVLASKAAARFSGAAAVDSGVKSRQADPSIAGRLADCFDLGRFMSTVVRHDSYPTD